MKKHSSIESLREEKAKLQLLCREKEAALTQSLEYVQEHFGSLVLKSLFPAAGKPEGIAEKVMQVVIRFFGGDTEKVSKLAPVLKIVRMFAAGMLYRYIRRIFRR